MEAWKGNADATKNAPLGAAQLSTAAAAKIKGPQIPVLQANQCPFQILGQCIQAVGQKLDLGELEQDRFKGSYGHL